jgi:hypothetical protein
VGRQGVEVVEEDEGGGNGGGHWGQRYPYDIARVGNGCPVLEAGGVPGLCGVLSAVAKYRPLRSVANCGGCSVCG